MKKLQDILKYTKDLVEQEPHKSAYWHYNKLLSKIEEAIDVIHCCETSIADFQINDKITFKQHRSGTITDVYIHVLGVKDVRGNYTIICKNDVIKKH